MNGGTRDTLGFKGNFPVKSRLGQQDRAQELEQGGLVLNALAVAGKTRVAGPLGLAEHGAQFGKQPIVATTNEQRTISGVEGFIGHKIGVPRRMPDRQLLLIQISLAVLSIPNQGRLQQGRIDDPTTIGVAAFFQHGQDTNDRPHASALVTHRGTDANGGILRSTIGAGQTTEGLDQRLVAWPPIHGARVPKGRNLTINQTRPARA